MNNYYVKLSTDTGEPFILRAASVEDAARLLAEKINALPDTIIYTWTERMWRYQLSPVEYYVWQVKDVSS